VKWSARPPGLQRSNRGELPWALGMAASPEAAPKRERSESDILFGSLVRTYRNFLLLLGYLAGNALCALPAPPSAQNPGDQRNESRASRVAASERESAAADEKSLGRRFPGYRRSLWLNPAAAAHRSTPGLLGEICATGISRWEPKEADSASCRAAANHAGEWAAGDGALPRRLRIGG
jgi:hypothetical protein